MSSVNFVPIDPACVGSPASPCSKTPQLVWSVAYAGHGLGNFLPVTRSCSPAPIAVASANSAAASLISLPVLGIATSTPILVVDVDYQFTPMFFGVASGPFDFWASGYWPIRSAAPGSADTDQYTRYDIANQAGGAGKCAGYN